MRNGIGLLVGALLVLPGCANAQEAEAPGLGDAAIAHVAVTANAIDAEMGDLALERSSNEEVRGFAATMVRDHRGVNEQAVALATRLGVTPEDNDVSRSLRQDGDAAKASLSELSGDAFDRAYMEREVAYHAAVLTALDSTLIPGSTNAELRSLLETARGAVAAHLAHARTLSETLATAGGQ